MASINENIKARECRLISADGEQLGVKPMDEALQLAQEAELDLVQIADGDPIVCKIMDFGKKLYEEKKQKAAAKKKQVQTQVKEIKFRPGTDEGDYQVKLRNLKRFVEGGDKVKVTLRFRGREMAHQELGLEVHALHGKGVSMTVVTPRNSSANRRILQYVLFNLDPLGKSVIRHGGFGLLFLCLFAFKVFWTNIFRSYFMCIY